MVSNMEEKRRARVVTKRWSPLLLQQTLCTPGWQPRPSQEPMVGWPLFCSLRTGVGHGFAGLESGQMTWPPFSLPHLNVFMGSGFVQSCLCPFPHSRISFKKSPSSQDGTIGITAPMPESWQVSFPSEMAHWGLQNTDLQSYLAQRHHFHSLNFQYALLSGGVKGRYTGQGWELCTYLSTPMGSHQASKSNVKKERLRIIFRMHLLP